jgi:hypothetical protein
VLIEQAPATRHHAVPKWVWICAVVIFGILTVLAIVLATHWPFTEVEITRALEQATGRKVVIRTFSKTYFPPGCVAEGVQVLHRSNPQAPPLISIQHLVVRGSYVGMFRSPKHISEVQVRGMDLQIPPKGEGQGSGGFPLFTTGGGGKSLVIDRISVDRALLQFMPGDPGKTPYRIDVRTLLLTGVGSESPWNYNVALFNTQPPGEIRAEGKFGPWNSEKAGSTPVSGSYEYRDANLGVFKGIDGKLTGKGEFHGPLARIETNGTTTVPDFLVDGSNHREKITTEFHATVNGTNGDVALAPVTAHFLKSRVIVKGDIASEAALDVSVPHGRLEDLLLLFVKGKAPMTGKVDFHSKVRIPGGDRPFLRKLAMDADFGIGSGQFTSPNTQDSIDRLSQSAQGESKKEEDEDSSTSLSDLRGHVSVKDGVARFSRVSFSFTGASASLEGTWGLIDHRFDLHGTLLTTGRLSDTTTGFKALIVKAVSPFLKKHHSAKVVPFRIKGPSSDPVITLDWGRAVSGK